LLNTLVFRSKSTKEPTFVAINGVLFFIFIYNTMNLPTSSPDVTCRTATNMDGEQIRKIVFDALKSYGLVLDPAATDVDLFDLEKYYPEGTFWVLVDADNTVKGSFALYRVDQSKAEIRKMYFDPSVRGMGLGTWAMYFLLHKAKTMGYQTLTLETASVLKEAIALYKKMGFQTVPGSCHSHRCDVVMEKRL
jgi:putative acetyltransferase